MMDLRSIASALGGEVVGRQVLAPGPGHSGKDRSLAIVPSPRAPGGFLVHSHCGDDWKECRDPRTFFVKSVKAKTADPAYCQNTFYEAWRLTIQRYGIYNPYTERGAIKGLLPHGPHNVRDVLATHILKVTGSYEQASYAIQDTPEMVASHYGRFLPQDKAALAAQILNRVWEAA